MAKLTPRRLKEIRQGTRWPKAGELPWQELAREELLLHIEALEEEIAQFRRTNNRLNRLGQTLEAALNQARSHPNSKLDHAVGAGYRLAQERYVRERGLLIALWKAAAEWAAAPHYWDESPDGLAAAAAVIEALEKLAEARWTPDGIEPEARWTLREPAPEGELKP